jgi:hypothetical protein
MSAPEAYVAWINEHVGFNPRGQAHSDFLTARIVADLVDHCQQLGDRFRNGQLELRQNVGLNGVRHSSPLAVPITGVEDIDLDPNIDGVVLGAGRTYALGHVAAPLTLENKTIMTAHGKARTNRFNDARAYASHVHTASPSTIAAFTIVINTSPRYRNPDAFARSAVSSGINRPDDAAKTIGLFRRMPLRNLASDPVNRCEAVLILAIDYDGETPSAQLIAGDPAPRAGDPYSYDWFLDRLCELFRERLTTVNS